MTTDQQQTKLKSGIRLVAIAMLVAACSPPPLDVPSNNGVCDYLWSIPTKNRYVDPPMFSSVAGIENLPRIFNVFWPAEELVNAVPGYLQVQEKIHMDLLSTISVIRNEDLGGWTTADGGSQLGAAFTRTGEIWGDARVEKNELFLGGFKIWRPRWPGLSWVVSKVDPRLHDGHLPLEDWFVGICGWKGGYIPDTQKIVRCTLMWRAVENISVEVSLAHRNLDLAPQIKAYMNQRIRDWAISPAGDSDCATPESGSSTAL